MTASGNDLRDPHRTYRRLREAGPIHRMELPGDPTAWVLIGYHPVAELLSHPGFSRDALGKAQLAGSFGRLRYPGDPFLFSGGPQLFNTDGAEHARLRRIIAPVFTHRAMARWRPMVAAVAREVTDRLAVRPEADLVADFAMPVAGAVIGHVLGAGDRQGPQLAALASAVISAFPHDPAQARRATLDLRRLTRQLIDQAGPRTGDDLLSVLIQAHGQEQTLRRAEVVSMFTSLLNAGYQTVASLLSYGALVLLADRDLAKRVRDDSSAMAGTVEELLRHEPSVPVGGPQFAQRPVELCGVTIAPGERVYPVFAAANRDPAVYPDPDRFQPGRAGPRALSFGVGRHRCPGAELARLEAQLALTELVRRLPQLRLAADPATLPRNGVLHLRGLARLPVRMDGGGR
ncbi:MAG TPA: cytochrome P450 [Micromonosporaceae bacterium]|nr:cytochrome P450 [Micromonosporaceae bacterium]